MITYSYITYALLCAVLILNLFLLIKKSFSNKTLLYKSHAESSLFLNIVILICVFALSLVSFRHYSVAGILYDVFDVPSFLLFIVCAMRVIRSFNDEFEVFISIKGMVFLLCIWGLFMLNTAGYLDMFYGTSSYKILIVSILIAVAYCVDRVCAVLMLSSFVMWMIFAGFIDVYEAVFDSLVCVCCVFLQGIPRYRDKFYTTLFQPKFRS